MVRPRNSVPSYRKHSSGRAAVTAYQGGGSRSEDIENYTFTAADKRVHAFLVILNSTGAPTLTATDALNALTSTASVSLASATAPPGGGGGTKTTPPVAPVADSRGVLHLGVVAAPRPRRRLRPRFSPRSPRRLRRQ